MVKWLAGCALALLIGGVAYLFIDNATYPARRARTADRIQRFATDIINLRNSNGAVPRTETELIRALGHQPPSSGWGTPIRYQPDGSNHFRLEATSPYPFWDTFVYRSCESNKGVVITSF